MANDPILVVGSFVQDLTFSTPRFPAPGETVVGTFLTGPGGKGSNQAVAARRAGAEVVFVGAVGDDAFAHDVRRFYGEEGIEARLAVYPADSTGTAGILFDRTGQNEIVVALGANDRIAPADVPNELLDRAGTVVCQLECNLDTVADVLSRSGERGKTRVLNPAPLREDLDPGLIDLAEILVPNESEFAALARLKGLDLPEGGITGLPPGELDALCRRLGPPTVIVTLGEAGAHVSEADGFRRVEPVRDIEVVDTTGAGDAFVGAFAAGLARFAGDTARAVAFANRAAALSVTRKGTAPAMARLDEIEP
jgi:ribokinase